MYRYFFYYSAEIYLEAHISNEPAVCCSLELLYFEVRPYALFALDVQEKQVGAG